MGRGMTALSVLGGFMDAEGEVGPVCPPFVPIGEAENSAIGAKAADGVMRGNIVALYRMTRRHSCGLDTPHHHGITSFSEDQIPWVSHQMKHTYHPP